MGIQAKMGMVEAASLHEKLQQMVESKQHSIQTIAEKSGLSYGSVYDFIETGKSSELTKTKLANVIPELEATSTEKKEVSSKFGDILSEVVSLSEFKRMVSICLLCREEKELGVIVGNPGVGKTTALTEFVNRYKNEAIFITARQEMSVKDFLDCIGLQLRVHLNGSVYQRVAQLIRALKANPKTLVIDEAENLITNTVRKGEILREIYDEANVGMILCGTFKLKSLFVKGPNNKENLAQLYSRVSYYLKVGTMSEDEAVEILSNYNVTEAAKKELVRIALDPSHGATRTFIKALRMALKVIDVTGGEINKDVLREATQYLILEN
ncbi:MAG: AAA family ATPase [Bacteroidota bacterium]